jgi:glycosyltransferase involved in cell wall biosynthesis
LQLAQDKLPNIQFRILGAGNSIPWYKIAEKYGIEKSVVFCGSIPINEVPNWLEDIDLYIQPSQAEGLPRALVEAMSRGCPALGSTVAGIPELLNRSYLHRPLDSVSLSNLLVKVLNNKQLRMEMAKENFIRSQQYNKVIIDRRRGDFWMRFHDYVRDGGQ